MESLSGGGGGSGSGNYPATILDSYHSHIYYARLRVQPTGLSLVIQSPLTSLMVNNGQYAPLGDNTYLTQINLAEIILFKFDRPTVKIFLRSIFHSYKILLSGGDYTRFRADCLQHYRLRLVDTLSLGGGAHIARLLSLQQSCFLLNREFPLYYEVIGSGAAAADTWTSKTSSSFSLSRSSSGNFSDCTARLAIHRIELDQEWDHQTNLTRLMHGLAKRKNNHARKWPDQLVIDEYWRERTAPVAVTTNNTNTTTAVTTTDSRGKVRDTSDSWRALIQSVYLSESTLAYINDH